VEYPAAIETELVGRPWRTAAVVAGAVAAVELVLLIGAGTILLGRAFDGGSAAAGKKKRAHAAAKAEEAKSPAVKIAKPKPAGPPQLTRGKTSVLVLNGNGETGAAATQASFVQARGYRIAGVGNAPRTTYAHSVIMFRPGFKAEGLRLGRDLGIQTVSPLDGIRPKQLQGAHAIVIVGG
jgi:hypothetical protein